MAQGWKIKVENKKKGIVYTRNTPFIDYLYDLRRIDICPEARKFYENAYSHENPTITFGKMVDKYLPHQRWARSMLMVYDGQLDKEIRKLYMDCVKDDVMNYLLWKNLVNITDEERNILRNKFRGKLPNIERKLK